jgi:DUF218 domain
MWIGERNVSHAPLAFRIEHSVNLRRRRILGVVLATAIFAAWALSKAGAALVVDAPRVSDTIIVLAGETDRRPALAESLLEQGYARHVVLDVPSNATIYNVSEMEIAKRFTDGLARGRGWSVCPITGLSTRDEVGEAIDCVSAASPDARSILVVTSDFHTRRALSVVRQIVRRQARGYDVSVAAAYDPSQFGTRWWTHRQWAKVCLDEWLRLLWWQTIDRWR